MKKLLDKMVTPQERYWALGNQQILADHFSVLQASEGMQLLPISDHQSHKFEGDYWGLLQDLGVDSRFHAMLTFFNGYSHPSDYLGTPGNVVVPSLETCEAVLRVNNSVSF